MAGEDEEQIVRTIASLVDREHHLREQAKPNQGAADDERAELEQLEVQLDQCWDLLRQRRARHEFNEPDDAHIRDADTLEGYQQ